MRSDPTRVVLDPRQGALDPGLTLSGTLTRFGYDTQAGQFAKQRTSACRVNDVAVLAPVFDQIDGTAEDEEAAVARLALEIEFAAFGNLEMLGAKGDQPQML